MDKRNGVFRRLALGVLALLLCGGQHAWAQDHEISGTISESGGAEGLPGVNVLVKGTSIGTVSDATGHYRLSAPGAQDTLVFSFVGYQTQEVPIAGRSEIDVRMALDVVAGEEVVVVGYGTQRRESISGSVATVSAEDIEERPVANPVQALQGRVPGLDVTQSTGQPGREGIGLRVRGVGSFASSNEPLVIVDGITGSLDDLNPSAIESISVLKDASSAAIYGARAANGVILVTTKDGSGAEGLQVDYSGKLLNQRQINFPDLVWDSAEYMRMYNRAIENTDGVGTTPYPEELISEYETPSDEYPSTNWAEVALSDVTVQSHNLSFQGTSGKTNYYVGAGYWTQDGVIDGFYYDKYTGTINLQSELSDRVDFGVSLKGVREQTKEPYNGSEDVMISILRSRPTYGPTVLDGSGNYASRAWPQYEPTRGEKNVVALADVGGQWDNHFGLDGTAFANVTLLDGLVWTSRLGMNYDQGRVKWQGPRIPTYNYRTGDFDLYVDSRGEIELRETMSEATYYTAYSTLEYERDLGAGHHASVMGGASLEKSTNAGMQGYRRGFAAHSLDVLGAGPSDGQTTNGWTDEYGLVSFFGRLNYDYEGTYLLEASVRRDGSSRFPPAHQYATFPSVSAAWRVSEESFFERALPAVTELKLRASYGTLGKDDVSGNYPYQASLDLGWDYPFHSGVQSGVRQTELNNRRIRWEETVVRDVGLDLEVKSGLLSLTADYYHKTTSGILRPAQIPGYAGLSAPVVNEGVVDNRGIELSLGHQNIVGDVFYGADFNLSAYRNKLVEFGSPQMNTRMMREGYEMNRYYIYKADGIYRSQQEIDNGPTPRWPTKPGDIKIVDVNEDGAITPDDRIDVDGAHPSFRYGMNLFANWKGFDASLFFQGEQGRKALLTGGGFGGWGLIPFVGGTGVPTWWRDAWSPENRDSDKPRLVFGDGANSSIWAHSTYWLRDVSYLRLKNATLGYTLPESLTETVGLGNARLYLMGENLLTFTGFEFGDPEQADTLVYPFFRTITFGLDVSF